MSSIRIVDVAGSAAVRGGELGRLLRGEIAEGVRRWQEHLRPQVGDPAAFASTFIARTGYLEAIKRWTPELLTEVSAMAAGAQIDPTDLLVAQLVDECWAHAAAIAGEHCSSIGIADPGSVVIAQNMDLEAFRDGLQIVVRHHPPAGPSVLVLTSPGIIAFNGVNSDGVAVCVNNLAQLAPSRSGLPVAFMIRAILDRASRSEAVDFARTVPHAIGQNYLIGGVDRATDLECGPGHVDEMPAEPVLLHTNHPLVDFTSDVDPRPGSLAASSYRRLDSLRARVGAGASIDDVKQALSAMDDPEHPVSRRAGVGLFFTFASTVMELSDSPLLHVTAGPPADNPYVVVGF